MNRTLSFICRSSGRQVRLPGLSLAALVLLFSLAIISAVTFAAGMTTRVSVASDGSQANNASGAPSISADGRFIAFHSSATNLVPNTPGGIYVHDRQTGTTEIVSVASDGTQANASSSNPSISADGRFVAFQSWATNLILGDTTICWNVNDTYGDIPCQDIFLHDRQTGITVRVSNAYNGGNRQNTSIDPSISADGRFVAFTSYAINLVPSGGNGTNSIYIYDRQTSVTEIASVASGGAIGNWRAYYASLSADGRFIAFMSSANNLVPGDTNGCMFYDIDYTSGYCPDIFVHDRQTSVTERVSVASDGSQANHFSERPKISADGRFVTFESWASNLVANDANNTRDVFVHDRQSGVTERISVAFDGTSLNNSSGGPAISTDGRFVVFGSFASNLVPDDTNNYEDVFIHDRQTGITERVSITSDGSQANSGSSQPAISSDGHFVAFGSGASNLVPGDTNGHSDVFVHERGSTSTLEITLDIKPDSFPNNINPRSNGVIPVAILSNGSFDASTADPATLRFGLTGQEAPAVHSALDDVDGDGDTDMILHFKTPATGIQCGATAATVTGETIGGLLIQGSDSINTVGCH